MADSMTATVSELLDRFASSAPLPGGGSAAALTGALGVSLLLMVAGMAKTRTGAPQESADLTVVAERLRPLRDTLTALIDDDSIAYQAVMTAYRLPRQSDDELTTRRRAIESAMQGATAMPLRTMRACQEALRHATAIVRFGNPNAVTDAAVGMRLLLAALESAAMNVEVNLPGVKDAEFVRASGDERRQLLSNARQLAAEVDAAIRQ